MYFPCCMKNGLLLPFLKEFKDAALKHDFELCRISTLLSLKHMLLSVE